MRILVIGANRANRGAEAMLLTMLSRISSEIPDVQWTVSSYSASDLHSVGPISHKDANGISVTYELIYKPKTIGTLIAQLLIILLRNKWLTTFIVNSNHFSKLVHSSDAVIDLSGFALSKNRPLWRILIYWIESKTAKALRKPFLVMTQSFGPFQPGIKMAVSRSALKSAEFISARGAQSSASLQSLGFVKDRDFFVSTDITYHFPPAPPRYVRSFHLHGATTPIAIIPNINSYNKAQFHGVKNSYVQLIAELCADLNKKETCRFVFVCQERHPTRFDDLALSRLIQECLLEDIFSTILTADNHASVLKSAISQCEIAIVSRFHGMLAALSTGVPTLTVAWANKYEESAAMAGIEGYTVDISTANLQNARERLNDLWMNRDSIRHRIKERTEHAKQCSDAALNRLAKMLTSLETFR